MITKVSSQPVLTISGSTYSASVPVTNYTENGLWPNDSTNLIVTGELTDTGSQFLTKLTTAANDWNATLVIRDTFQTKLSNLVGRKL